MSGPLIKNIIDMKHAKELPIAASHKPIGANAISVSPKNSAAAALLNRFKSGLTKGTCFQNVAKIPAELAELKRIRDTNKIYNLFFLPRVSESYIYNYYKKSDALIVHLKNSDLFKITIPSKTQSYMAFGKPIIMVAKGDAANLIKKSKSGVVSNPDNPNSLIKAIFKLKSMDSSSLIQLGINGRDFYYKKLAMKIGSKKLFAVFQSLIRR